MINQQPQQPQSVSPQAVEAALRTGMKLLTSEVIDTPNAWNKDLGTLQDILGSLLVGQLVLAPPKGLEEPKE